MHFLSDLLFFIALYALVRAGDIAITSSRAGDVTRAVIYGILAVLLLIAILLSLLGIH